MSGRLRGEPPSTLRDAARSGTPTGAARAGRDPARSIPAPRPRARIPSPGEDAARDHAQGERDGSDVHDPALVAPPRRVAIGAGLLVLAILVGGAATLLPQPCLTDLALGCPGFLGLVEIGAAAVFAIPFVVWAVAGRPGPLVVLGTAFVAIPLGALPGLFSLGGAEPVLGIAAATLLGAAFLTVWRAIVEVGTHRIESLVALACLGVLAAVTFLAGPQGASPVAAVAAIGVLVARRPAAR